jgi:hypothetical protein
MKRLLVGLLSGTAIAVLVAACDDGPRGYESGYGGGDPRCGQYATCGTCTPALGCGWCMTGGANGFCVDSPGDCPPSTVGWTWEPVGCHVVGDASVLAEASVGGDASAPTDAGRDAADAGIDARDTGVPPQDASFDGG